MTSELCRLCLGKENLKPIFTKTDSTVKYSVLLLVTTGLHIKINDGLPQSVCNACTELVNSAQQLRDQSCRSEIDLLKLGYRRSFSKLKEQPIIHNYDEDSTDMPNFEILVELDTLTGMKEEEQKPDLYINANDSDIFKTDEATDEDIQPNIKTEKSGDADTKTVSREDKRAVYMNLVEGVFDPKGPIKCRICKTTIGKWASFLTHCKKHLGFKLVCEYCGKSFIYAAQLNRHCRSHHGMQSLPCPHPHCDYYALDNAQLLLHERKMHTGERPFVCDLCGTSYFSRRCLIQHMENHSTVKTIQCERCPQLFKSRRHLARHTYSTHTSKQYTYKCPVCGHIYRNFKYIRVHLRKLHGLTSREAKIIKIKL